MSLNTKQAIFIVELDLNVAICVEDINDEVFLASPGLFTYTTVCFVNL